MPAFSLQVVIDNLSHVGLEILVFVAIEISARLVFVRQTASWKEHAKLLLVQGIALTGVTLLLAAWHHTPYILLLLLLAVCIRLVLIGARFLGPISRTGNETVSAPLLHTSELGDERPFELEVPPLRPPIKQQPPGLHVASYKHSTNNGGYVGEERSLLWTRFGNGPPPAVAPEQNAYHSVKTTAAKRKLGVPSERLHIPVNNSILNKPSSSLRRSPMPTTFRSPLYTPPSPTSRLQESFFHHTPSFGYFGSLLNTPLPSTTPAGILNAGNTCFVNSVLQCLTWTPGFVDVISGLLTGNEVVDELLYNLNGVLQKCRVLPDGETHFSPVDASVLLGSLSQCASHLAVPRDCGQYQSQQDVAEFLLWLLDYLHELLRQDSPRLSPEELNLLTQRRQVHLLELEKANSIDIPSYRDILRNVCELDWQLHTNGNYSKFYDLFMGQLVEARECQQCKKMSVNMEYFTVLPLPLPSGTAATYSLENCLTHFMEVENLVEANMLLCPCVLLQSQESTPSLAPGKRLALLSKPPRRLVIQLTRFSYDTSRNTAVKTSVPIAFPTTFDLYQHSMYAKLNLGEKQMPYELYAFCTHSGAQSTSHGHYMAYCKATNGSWYCFNDGSVTRITNIQGTLSSVFALRNAYLLFYASQAAPVPDI